MSKSKHYKMLQDMARIYQKNNPKAAKKEAQRLKAKIERNRERMKNIPINIKIIPISPVAFALKDVSRPVTRAITITEDMNHYGPLRKKVGERVVFIERMLKVWTLIWTPKKKEGRTANIKINENVWTRIILLSKLLKEKEYDQGDVILLWRISLMSTWVCFATNKQFAEIAAPCFKRGKKEEMRKVVPWTNSRGDYNEELFEKYYGGGKDEKD